MYDVIQQRFYKKELLDCTMSSEFLDPTNFDVQKCYALFKVEIVVL
jgi:hypothetical protein